MMMICTLLGWEWLLTGRLCRYYHNVGSTTHHRRQQLSVHSALRRTRCCLDRLRRRHGRAAAVRRQRSPASCSCSPHCGWSVSTRCVEVQPTSPASSTFQQFSQPMSTSSTSCPGSFYRDNSSPSGYIHCSQFSCIQWLVGENSIVLQVNCFEAKQELLAVQRAKTKELHMFI